MTEDFEQRVRKRAYRIWLAEGCPEGRDKTHWDMATELVAIEDQQKAPLKPVEEEKAGPQSEPVERVEAAKSAGETLALEEGEVFSPAKRRNTKSDIASRN
jgi:hypothetical protein